MKTFLLSLMFLLPCMAFGQATQLSGTLKNPDGSGYNGFLLMSLAQQAAISSGNNSSSSACGGPVFVPSTIQIRIQVVNGAMQSAPHIYGSDCTLPAGIPYNVIAQDTNGNVDFTAQWLPEGNTQDIGTIVAVSNPLGTLFGLSLSNFVLSTQANTFTQATTFQAGVNVYGTLSLGNGGNGIITDASGGNVIIKGNGSTYDLAVQTNSGTNVLAVLNSGEIAAQNAVLDDGSGNAVYGGTVNAVGGFLANGTSGGLGQILESNGSALVGIYDFLHDFDIRNYGAVTGSDATTAIQAAVTAAATAGGIVYIPKGVWQVNGSINGACDAIICLPAVLTTSSAEAVKIVGTTRNRQDAQGPNNTSGSVITTTTSGDTSSAVFGVPLVSAPFGNNIDAYFSDLTIRTYPNPAIGCINMYQAAGSVIENVRCEVGENYSGSHTQPTNVATGITLPRTGNDSTSVLHHAEITGYYQGVNFSEHADFEDVWVAFGVQGYFLEASYNPITGHFGCEEVGVCVETSGGGGGQLDVDIAIELDPMNVFGCASWCYTATDIYDANNLINGWVRYYKSEANVGNISTPISVNIGAALITAATYYNLYTNQFNKVIAPIFTAASGTPTCTKGTGVSGCTFASNSNATRGTVTLNMSGVSIDTPLATFTFSPLAGIAFCQVTQAAGNAFYGLYVGGSPTTSTYNINNSISLTGVTTLVFGYSCSL